MLVCSVVNNSLFVVRAATQRDTRTGKEFAGNNKQQKFSLDNQTSWNEPLRLEL